MTKKQVEEAIKHPSLKAMAEEKVDGIQKATYFKVHPDKVEFEDGFNLREEGPELDAHLEAMYVAMKAGAAFPPIDVSVVEGRVIARDGHCRTRTARRLVAEGIPYMLETRQFRGNETECVFHMLGSSQGKPLTPLESGRGFLRLTRWGVDTTAIAQRTGLSRTTIENGLLLAEAPVDVQKMLVQGTVSVQVVLDMLRKHGSKAAEALKATVDKAQAAGVKKVTKKHVASPKVPQHIVQSFVSAAGAIRKSLGEKTFKSLMDIQELEVNYHMVSVPAINLKALLTAHAALAPKEDEL